MRPAPASAPAPDGEVGSRAANQARTSGKRADRFTSPEAVEAFFSACDALEGPEREPDWDEHLSVIAKSRRRSSART